MKNLFFVVLILISLKQHAQNSAINLIKDGTITGTVLDKADNQPLPYVTIVIKDEANNTLTGSITDDSGEFKISDIPLGKVIVNIQFIGYKTITKNIRSEERRVGKNYKLIIPRTT